jgi:hypothetical protein
MFDLSGANLSFAQKFWHQKVRVVFKAASLPSNYDPPTQPRYSFSSLTHFFIIIISSSSSDSFSSHFFSEAFQTFFFKICLKNVFVFLCFF